MSALASYPILAVIFFIGLLIFVHELGHFLVGKAFGIGVETFSIGFGPKILSFRHGETEYKVSILPLGGFVKFAGALPSEEVPEAFKGKEMHRASFAAKSLTLLAGPLANIALACVIYTVHGYQGIEHAPAVIGSVMPGSVAEKSGLMAGDKVLSINGEGIFSWDQLRSYIAESPAKTISLSVSRDEEAAIQLNITPEAQEVENFLGQKEEQGRIGISYGLVPPIVTINHKDITTDGLTTGSYINKITYISNSNGEKIENKIETWPQLLAAIEKAFVNQSPTLEISYFATQGPQFKSKDAVTEMVKLDTAQWLQDNQDLQEAPKNLVRQQKLTQSLGLEDSQLTIASAKGPLEEIFHSKDKLISFDGQKISDIFSLYKLLTENKKERVEIAVLRNNEEILLTAPLEPVTVQKATGKDTFYRLNLIFWAGATSPKPYVEKYDSLWSSFIYGIKESAEKSMGIVKALAGLITGSVPLQSLGGPMLIAKVAGDAAAAGWMVFFSTMAIISINLGVVNLFPIPALDGGNLCLAIYTWIRRRPLSEEALENFHRVGFVMVMSLVVLATYNDLSRFWSSMIKGLTN